MRRVLRFFLGSGLAAGLAVLLGQGVGDLPALGKLLNPFHGLWQRPLQTRRTDLIRQVQGLSAPVEILWDEFSVPHFRAVNELDLALAQGFVHASQRLFQMDVQARGGGARLAALLGQKAINWDRYFLSIGLREVVRRTAAAIKADPQTYSLAQAYVAGVNQWIENLTEDQWPTEYRLLGVGPNLWQVEQIAELFSTMGFRLSGRTFDLNLTQIQQKWGLAAVRDLFPEFMPKDLEAPFADGIHGRNLTKALPEKEVFQTTITNLPDLIKPFAGNGSNSWAVMPGLSKSGRTILANDTHLGFSLPNIWFEQQLSDAKQNVYGGGFPGMPGVLSGFTQTAAWAVTNGTTDVMDWYDFKFKSNASNEYENTDGWKIARVQQEIIEVRGSRPILIDQEWTELGPIVHRQGQHGVALRWTLHDGSNPLRMFYDLNHASNRDECLKALPSFQAPIQNVLCADKDHISLVHNGAIPQRWSGQGQVVMSGSDARARWGRELTFSERPQNHDPKMGFLFSANQRPVDASYPPSLGMEAENSYRAREIQSRLSERSNWSAEDFVALQTDVANPLARQNLPKLLEILGDPDPSQMDAVRILRSWNYQDDLTSVASSVFFVWWRRLEREIWSDQLGPSFQGWPRDERLQVLLRRQSGDEIWIDDATTPNKETLKDIVHRSLSGALSELQKNYGSNLMNWEWQVVRPLEFRHIIALPGFSEHLKGPGGRHSINAIQEHHGPTWRMVVSLGETPQAWTSTPSRSEGDPLSVEYGSALKAWAQGGYKQIHFLAKTATQDETKIPWSAQWVLKPGGK